MPSTKRDYAYLVFTLRERLGLPQEKLAAKLGVSFLSVSRWERRICKPSPMALKQMKELLERMGDRGKDLLTQYFPE